MKLLEFLEESIGGDALGEEFVAEFELLGRRLPCGARLGDHAGREREENDARSWREESQVQERACARRVARCCRLFSSRAHQAVAAPDLIVFGLDAVAVLTFLVVLIMPPAGTPPNRALPSKESGLFKEVLHHYEDRQLKKGLKTADTILKKFPNHGGMSFASI